MSRSYKKQPCYKDHSPKGKNLANRKIRRMKNEDIPDGNAYKKYSDSWSISDYKFYNSWEEYLMSRNRTSWYINDRPLNEEEIKDLKNEWNKYYRRK